MRATDNQGLELLDARIESRLGSKMCVQRFPLTRRIKREAALPVEREIRDIQTIVILALQNFAKAGRDTDPPFLIDRMVETTAEHSPDLPDLPQHPTLSHLSKVNLGHRVTIK